jgi:hypothetical protein
MLDAVQVYVSDSAGAAGGSSYAKEAGSKGGAYHVVLRRPAQQLQEVPEVDFEEGRAGPVLESGMWLHLCIISMILRSPGIVAGQRLILRGYWCLIYPILPYGLCAPCLCLNGDGE